MQRVVYVTPLYFDEASYLGGGERYPLNLAKAVARAGHYDVEIVSTGDRSVARTVPIEDGVRLRVLPAANRRAGAEPLSWDIVSVVRDADVVHLHQMYSRPAEVALLAAKLLHKPVCATDHGGASSRLGSSLGMVDLVDRIICYSRFSASLVVGSQAVEIVPGGVDDSLFAPAASSVERDRLVFVGRLLPHKGIDRLLAALPAGVRLSICGSPYDAEYYELLRALAAGKQVEFVTDANDEVLRDQYQRAIAVVLPSVYVDCYGTGHAWPELMGFSLLEGMACGAPAICSRVGGMPEYVDHGHTGFVYDELAQLTEHIERLASEPALVGQLGLEARRRVTSCYGLESAGSAMSAIYDDISETRHRYEGARDHQLVSA